MENPPSAASGRCEVAARGRRPRRLLAAVLAIVGCALLGGGVQLVLLGGSIYYVPAGLAVLASALFSWRGDRRAIWAYVIMLAASMAWSLWECGLDLWGLQARLAAPAVLGFWVCWPALRARPLCSMAGTLLICAAAWFAIAKTYQGERFPFPSRLAAASVGPPDPTASASRWLNYGNDPGGSRYSTASLITPANVDRLQLAWTAHTGDMGPALGFEATPLMVDDTLYLCSPTNIIMALDADTGKARWVFDPHSRLPPTRTCRGVAYYKAPGADGQCAERILFATVDARLMAVDALDGRPCRDFGQNGAIDLWRGMGRAQLGYYLVTSAPTIVDGNVIVGGWVADGQYVGEPSGVVRAYGAATGRFAWAWDMDRPHEHGEPSPGRSYSRGTANSWAPMSGDETLHLVFLPTGNSTPDYWGAHRSAASETYGSSVVALDSRTGELRWSFQTTHHDLWDYDVASQPTLVDLPIGGAVVPALIQPTKRGQVFVLDRRNGHPLTPVRELPAPQRPSPGDFLAPTQPFSTGMPAFDDTRLSEAGMWGATPLDQLWCRIKFRQARYDGPLTPPGLGPTVTYPSYAGGINWGGVSIDPVRRLMTVNWNRLGNYTRLVPRAEADAMGIVPSNDGGAHVGSPVAQKGTPFALSTGPFLSPLAMPCTPPPFGRIAVVDLDTRRLLWSRPLGTTGYSGPFGLPLRVPLPIGVPNSGGSIMTRSGLTFIAASQDRKIRAFDSLTGKILWQAPLPAGGNATPMTYVTAASKRQYLVIAAGGNAILRSGSSDTIMAFALPSTRHAE